MSHLDQTHVVRWSGITFTAPVPLIPRRCVKVGDVVMSSHGYTLLVTQVINDPGYEVVQIGGRLHASQTGALHTERHAGSIPLLERQGVVFGQSTFTNPWPDVAAVPTAEETKT